MPGQSSIPSCDACRRRKTKCDHKAECSGCVMRGEVCMYRNGPPKLSPEGPPSRTTQQPLQMSAYTAATRTDRDAGLHEDYCCLRIVVDELASRLNLSRQAVDDMLQNVRAQKYAPVEESKPALLARQDHAARATSLPPPAIASPIRSHRASDPPHFSHAPIAPPACSRLMQIDAVERPVLPAKTQSLFSAAFSRQELPSISTFDRKPPPVGPYGASPLWSAHMYDYNAYKPAATFNHSSIRDHSSSDMITA